jgi:phosphate transport system substrate-binding protein
MRRLIAIVLVGACVGVFLYFLPGMIAPKAESRNVQIHLGGTSGAFFMMDQWESVYRKEKGIQIDYASTGSTQGVMRMIDKKYAIGFTHAALTEEQKKTAKSKGGDVIYIPVVLCAVVPSYNVKALKDKPPLNFTGEILGDIFLGKIVKWNDPALKKLNPSAELPDLPIKVVHRADSSGTTMVFAEFLEQANAAWKEKMGPAQSKFKDWPVGVSKDRNQGVALHIAETEGAIGYVDLLYAVSKTYGAVQNKDKTAFIHAEPENITAAANGLAADIKDDLTFDLINKPGKNSYPISGAVWTVCYQNQPKGNPMVVDFLTWITHEGQKYAKARTYAPLPEEIIARVDQQLKLIKSAK